MSTKCALRTKKVIEIAVKTSIFTLNLTRPNLTRIPGATALVFDVEFHINHFLGHVDQNEIRSGAAPPYKSE